MNTVRGVAPDDARSTHYYLSPHTNWIFDHQHRRVSYSTRRHSVLHHHIWTYVV